jgi:hypothetical protein
MSGRYELIDNNVSFIPYCISCRCVVWDIELHDKFHDEYNPIPKGGEANRDQHA